MTVSTIGNAGDAIRRLQESQNKQADTRTNIKAPGTASLPQDTVEISDSLLNVASAAAASEVQNRDAAKSVLSDDEFDKAVHGDSAQEKIQQQAVASAAAQTNKLPPNILSLLAE
jgi:hypothetical protein